MTDIDIARQQYWSRSGGTTLHARTFRSLKDQSLLWHAKGGGFILSPIEDPSISGTSVPASAAACRKSISLSITLIQVILSYTIQSPCKYASNPLPRHRHFWLSLQSHLLVGKFRKSHQNHSESTAIKLLALIYSSKHFLLRPSASLFLGSCSYNKLRITVKLKSILSLNMHCTLTPSFPSFLPVSECAVHMVLCAWQDRIF